MTHTLYVSNVNLDDIDFDDPNLMIIYDDDGSSIHMWSDTETFIFACKGLQMKAQPGNRKSNERKLFLKMVENAIRYNQVDFLNTFKQVASELLSPSTTSLTINLQGDMIHDKNSDIDGKDVNIQTFLIQKHNKNPANIKLDAEQLFRLCKTKIDIGYIVSSLKASSTSDILLVIARDPSANIVGIRGTKLQHIGSGHNRHLSSIFGMYLCSDGWGTVLQNKTEEYIRMTLVRSQMPEHGKTGDNRPTTRHMKTQTHYSLWALDSAVGFWEKVGFTRTGQTKGNLTKMHKIVLPDDSSSGTSAPVPKRIKK